MGIKNILLKSIILLNLLIVGFNLQAQLVDADTTQIITQEPTPKEFHSPKKASLYSAILPGLGQAYNKKYWKIPLVYMGLGGIGYFIGWNNNRYQINKNAYNDLTDNDPNTNSFLEINGVENFDLDNNTSYNNFKTGLNQQQEYFRRNRDLLVISLFAFYGLNIIDAGVDAHLFNFDMSDDLTFYWQPSMLNINNQTVYCVNFTFNF